MKVESATPSTGRPALNEASLSGTLVAEQIAVNDLSMYINILTHSWSKTLTTLGFTLIPIFFILDVFMMPRELLPRFAIYRGAASFIMIMQHIFLRHTRPNRYSALHGYFFTIVASLMIALMTTDLGGFNSTYYAGLNLVLIAVNMLLPWEFVHSAVNGAIIIGLYMVLNFIVPQEQHASFSIIVNNLYFLTGTAIISTSINYVKQRLIKQEFFLRNDLKSARDALWGEMEVAKHIQTALLPKVHQIAGYSVAAAMVPAMEVGGDYYDLIETSAGESWACIGDVSGHGVESGLIMMMTQTSVFTSVNDKAGLMPSQVLTTVNRVIKNNISRLGADRYMTISLMRLEKDAVVHGGKHQDILVHRCMGGVIDVIPSTGTWLGLVDDLSDHIQDARIPIGIGDTLLLYTDGVTEAANKDGEMFGEERLQQLFNRFASARPEQIVSGIMREVQQHMHEQADDLTIVVLRRVD